jgi:hypothetical protein
MPGTGRNRVVTRATWGALLAEAEPDAQAARDAVMAALGGLSAAIEGWHESSFAFA